MPELTDASMSDAVTVAVIVVAAGSGTRLGQPRPKAFVDVEGRTVLGRSLDSIFQLPEAVQIIVVAPAELVGEARIIGADAAGAAHASVTVVPGGATRQLSVAAGLAVLRPSVDTVLVHDSARALTPHAQFAAVISAVRETGAGVIPGLPVSDTIKRVTDGIAVETVDRSQLTAVQTPQGFPRAQLVAAYAAAEVEYTDDAALFSAAGLHVSVIEGDPLAFKITTRWDLRRATSLVLPVPGPSRNDPAPVLASGAAPEASTSARRQGASLGLRTGIGIDVHGYDPNEPLWLGGLYWPNEVGLAGHSDGDVVMHAICDALLSAAGLGDIGGRFGTADPRFENARGEVFVRATLELVRADGFEVENVAVQVIGNTPRLNPRRIEIEQHLTSLVGAPVSVSATTSDGLGFTGRGEGISAIATALLRA